MLVYHLSLDRTSARLEAATDALERARALDPDMPELHLAAGEYHYRSSSDLASALAEFDLAARGMPEAPELLFSRALVYKRLGRWEQALETFEQARKLDPRSPRLLFNQADTYKCLREYEVAQQYVAQIAAFGMKDMHADMWQAETPLLRDGDVTALHELPVVDVQWVKHLKWLASLYRRDYDAAVELLDRWTIDAFGWPLTYTSLSGAYSVTFDLAGRHEEARRKALHALAGAERALASNHDDPSPFIGLGEAHAILGNQEQAVGAARQALAMRPPSRDAYAAKILQIDCIMRIYVRAGAFDDAIETLDEYLGTRGGCWSIEGLLPDPRLDPIRGEPRFAGLVAKHRRREHLSE
jgi:tetratricopeptide (TPR) repeat protein